MPDTTPPVHLRFRRRLDEAVHRLALRATLNASHLLGLAAGTHLRALRGQGDPLADLKARLDEAELRARLAWEATELLAARFAKIPERHRPYFTPAQRFRILEIKNFLSWSARDTARLFLVCSNTILNWENAADSSGQTVGSTLKPEPPIRRAADVVHSLVQVMARRALGGQNLAARILGRAGWRISARSIGRYRRERPVPLPPTPGPTSTARTTRPVVARFVHHTWMLDVSLVRQLLGPDLFMACVFDAFSRTPLAFQIFQTKPGAKAMAQLLRRAARAFVKPRYVITDLGPEFGGAFQRAVSRLGAFPRFASKDSLKATARLERFWRTLKESAGLYRLHLPLTAHDLERRLELALLHYFCFRPHEGLKGATPAEAFLDLEPACTKAVEPPRGRPGEGPAETPFRIEYLDPGLQRFPILKLVA